MSECYLGKILWDALMLLFSLFDHALQSTVGECVALVELQITLVSEETASSFWSDVPDPIRGDNCGREVDKVLSSSFQRKTLVPHPRELCRISNEHLEGIVLLVKGTEGHCVGVEVQGVSLSPFFLPSRDFTFCTILSPCRSFTSLW